ncbi:MAG: DUF5343 domain-containing protein [Chloroflexi bacterium]|nr:DUF5343 domain-containing protein [Chloroflexota bacterium]
MANYPYVYSIPRFREFLSQIKRVRDPGSVDFDWLKKLSFEQGNDRAFYRVLQYIAFLTEGNETTDLWRSFRVEGELSGSMATAITQGYSQLFEMYEEAWNCTDDELKSVFKQAGASDRVAVMALSTFRALCSLADFEQSEDATSAVSSDMDKPATDSPPSKQEQPQRVSAATVGGKPANGRVEVGSFAPKIHIDIQVHIDPDADPAQIDEIFASMAKHLFNNDSS